jgi:hypothetical protein
LELPTDSQATKADNTLVTENLSPNTNPSNKKDITATSKFINVVNIRVNGILLIYSTPLSDILSHTPYPEKKKNGTTRIGENKYCI